MEKFRLPKCLAALTLAAGLTVTNAAAFTDTEGHWAESAIEKWSGEYGILRGYEDGSFGPGASITRGQMAKILYHLL